MIKFKGIQYATFLPYIILCLLGSLAISACAQTLQGARTYTGNGTSVPLLDDSAALAAQAEHAIKREISVIAPVKKLLPDDVKGLPHQRFLIELSNGSTILIAHDLKYAPAVPIKSGDIVSIRGEYIWNKLGGLIHWTHHTDTPRHENGWIDFNGVRYQ